MKLVRHNNQITLIECNDEIETEADYGTFSLFN